MGSNKNPLLIEWNSRGLKIFSPITNGTVTGKWKWEKMEKKERGKKTIHSWSDRNSIEDDPVYRYFLAIYLTQKWKCSFGYIPSRAVELNLTRAIYIARLAAIVHAPGTCVHTQKEMSNYWKYIRWNACPWNGMFHSSNGNNIVPNPKDWSVPFFPLFLSPFSHLEQKHLKYEQREHCWPSLFRYG